MELSSPLTPLDPYQIKHEALSRVKDSVDLFLFSWDVTSSLETAAGDDASTSQGHFASRSKMRARKALERIYKAAPSDVLDDLAVHWDRLHAVGVSCFLFVLVPGLSLTLNHFAGHRWRRKSLCHASDSCSQSSNRCLDDLRQARLEGIRPC